MHPEIVKNAPGKCPGCGMDLIPQKVDPHAGRDMSKMPARQSFDDGGSHMDHEAAIYNVLAIPVAAGVFYHSLGWTLRPEIAALLMSASSIIVATNAVLLKRVEPRLKI